MASLELAIYGAPDAWCMMLNGNVSCWGTNTLGRLGTGNTMDASVPTKVGGLAAAATHVCISDHACAALSAGGVQCWGSNDHNQLGIGDTIDRLHPTTVVGLTDQVVQLHCGSTSSCALTSSRVLYCWGYNFLRNNGYDSGNTVTPTVVAGEFNSSIAEFFFTEWQSCVLLLDMTLSCWHYNYWDGDYWANQTTSVKQVAMSDTHQCILYFNGSLSCSGSQNLPELGLGTSGNAGTVTFFITAAESVSLIFAGYHTTFAVTTDGSSYAWGDNTYQQLLFVNPTTSSPVPDGYPRNSVTTSYSLPQPSTFDSASLKTIASAGIVTCLVFNNDTFECTSGSATSSPSSDSGALYVDPELGFGAGFGSLAALMWVLAYIYYRRKTRTEYTDGKRHRRWNACCIFYTQGLGERYRDCCISIRFNALGARQRVGRRYSMVVSVFSSSNKRRGGGQDGALVADGLERGGGLFSKSNMGTSEGVEINLAKHVARVRLNPGETLLFISHHKCSRRCHLVPSHHLR